MAAANSPAVAQNSQLRLPYTVDPPGEENPPTEKVWVVCTICDSLFSNKVQSLTHSQVFGATGHMGRSIVKACISHKDKVTAVGRIGENSMAQMQGWHDSVFGQLCDIRVPSTVDAVLKKTVKKWGRMDIIVKYDFPRIQWSRTHSLIPPRTVAQATV